MYLCHISNFNNDIFTACQHPRSIWKCTWYIAAGRRRHFFEGESQEQLMIDSIVCEKNVLYDMHDEDNVIIASCELQTP